MTVPAIHLVYKTHLDIGFTDHAERVRQQYHNQFIPQAIATGEHFFAEDSEHPKFIWTTGAWLIWDHLNSQDAERVRRLERAIERGLIAWHALPFTTHTELMLPSLFRAGLSYAQGIRVNLYNNKWGTNFPMWWEGDGLFRFVLTIS
jgi:hypothetical protein